MRHTRSSFDPHRHREDPDRHYGQDNASVGQGETSQHASDWEHPRFGSRVAVPGTGNTAFGVAGGGPRDWQASCLAAPQPALARRAL
jgi:hypothetical protein